MVKEYVKQFFMDKDIVSALIGIGGVVIGFSLTEVSGYFRNRLKKKEDFYLAHYKLRQEAYSELYIALINLNKYFLKFVNPGNEFYEMETWENYSPLSEKDKFNDIYYKVEIWVDEEVINKIEEIMSRLVLGCNLAMQINSEYDDDLFGHNTVVNHCKEVICLIEELKKIIRKKCKLDKLDEYISNIEK